MTLDETEAFSIQTLCKDAQDIVRPRAQLQRNRVTASVASDLPPFVMGDGGRVRQVLINLLGNACKFTKDGLVTVRAALANCTRAPASTSAPVWVSFSVTDTGIGIEPQVRDRLFQPFVQANPSTTREFGGTGLGLAISRKLVEAMGGTIDVESVLGQGSTFRFEIPFKLSGGPPRSRSVDEAKASLQAQATTASTLRVLVAEDDAVNQKVVRRMLDKLGVQKLDVVNDGQQAVNAIRDHPAGYDIVFMGKSPRPLVQHTNKQKPLQKHIVHIGSCRFSDANQGRYLCFTRYPRTGED